MTQYVTNAAETPVQRTDPVEVTIRVNEERPSLVAFKKYICNRYRVDDVDDTPLTVEQYAEMMDVYEAGWRACEQKILDKILEKEVRL